MTPKIQAWIATITGLAAVTGIGVAIYNNAPVPDSVEEFHYKAMEPMQDSLENIETNAVVDRIMRIQEGRCDNQNLQRIVNEQMVRYKELTGREFGLTPCAAEE